MDEAAICSALGVSRTFFRKLVSGKSRVSDSLATVIAEHFGETRDYWLGLQKAYDEGETARSISDRVNRVARDIRNHGIVDPYPRGELRRDILFELSLLGRLAERELEGERGRRNAGGDRRWVRDELTGGLRLVENTVR